MAFHGRKERKATRMGAKKGRARVHPPPCSPSDSLPTGQVGPAILTAQATMMIKSIEGLSQVKRWEHEWTVG